MLVLQRADRELVASTGVGALPLPAVSKLSPKRNAVEQLLIQNSGHSATMAVVAQINLAEWPAVQGRAVYLLRAIQNDIQQSRI